MRKISFCASIAIILVLSGCGGGGSGSDSGPGSSQAPSGPVSSAGPVGPNAVAITLENVFANVPTTTITVCVPGTTQCQTIDNVRVDTASSGVRIFAASASELIGNLPKASATGVTNLAECAKFAGSYAFGSVRLATVQIAGETATKIPIQLIGDSSYPNAPSDCRAVGPALTEGGFNGNGILGINVQPVDCAELCALFASSGFYYDCNDVANCAPVAVPVEQQIVNPVTHFATDNNGVIVEMPPIGANGATTATGTLVFGIGTQSNNTLDSGMHVIRTDGTGVFSVTYNNVKLTDAFIDSGTNSLAFQDSTLGQCSSSPYYCPASVVTRSVVATGNAGTSTTITFNVANADTLSKSGAFAADDLAASSGTAQGVFVFGMPFFYGRRVALAIGGGSTPAGMGPFVAF